MVVDQSEVWAVRGVLCEKKVFLVFVSFFSNPDEPELERIGERKKRRLEQAEEKKN